MSHKDWYSDAERIYEGYLKKSPHVQSKSIFNLIAKLKCTGNSDISLSGQRWRKRYFVLLKTVQYPAQYKLLYFKGKPTLDNKNMGSIDLNNMESMEINIGHKVSRYNTFSIKTCDSKGNDRTYYLCADSPDIMNNWVDCIANVLKLDSNKSPVPFSSLRRNISAYTSRSQQHSFSSLRPAQINHSRRSLDFPCTTPTIRSFSENANYYNLDAKLSPTSNELEEPMCMVDDVYKLPNELNAPHAYVNLENDSAPPTSQLIMDYASQKKANDLNFEKPKSDLFITQEYKTLTEDNEKVLLDESSQLVENNYQYNNKDDTNGEFNFQLPTRLKSCSFSSSNSSEGMSSNESSSSVENETYHTPPPLQLPLPPPEVPRRCFAAAQMPVPTKPPKTTAVLTSAADNHDKENNEPHLNYIENGCLDLPPQNDNSSSLSQSQNIHNHHHHHHQQSLSIDDDNNNNFIDEVTSEYSNLGLSSAVHNNLRTSSSETMKDETTMVEYKEISLPNTEAIFKLKDLI